MCVLLTDGGAGAVCVGARGFSLCNPLLLVLKRETRQISMINPTKKTIEYFKINCKYIYYQWPVYSCVKE